MRTAKCREDQYIDFPIASPHAVTCTEAAAVQPPSSDPPAHDAFNRLLHRLRPDPEDLWREVRPLIPRTGGLMVLDDTTLDKPFAKKMDLVHRQWSGRHRRVVRGIDLISLVWTDGDHHLPCDYRLYDKPTDGLTKNDHFRAMLRAAHRRGLRPACVAFDGWYAGTENLEAIPGFGWRSLTQLKSNREVNRDRQGLRPLDQTAIAPAGTEVWLEGFGLIRVFKIVSRDGGIEYWAANDLEMDELGRQGLAEQVWAIEDYHRGLKQCRGVERAQVRSARAQRNHIGLSIRAFARLSWHFFTTGISWYEAKRRIVRDAIRGYLAQPLYRLPLIA